MAPDCARPWPTSITSSLERGLPHSHHEPLPVVAITVDHHLRTEEVRSAAHFVHANRQCRAQALLSRILETDGFDLVVRFEVTVDDANFEGLHSGKACGAGKSFRLLNE